MKLLGPVSEALQIALRSITTEKTRSVLAIAGVVIGIVTVVLMASILANVRSGVALLFRELGTDNVFAYHRSGDPYAAPSEAEANRKPLDPQFAREIERLADLVRAAGVQILVPAVVNGQALTARAGSNESETVLVEGASANYFQIVGAEFQAGRPFTNLEDQAAARVAILGANLSKALFGASSPIGRTVTLGGQRYFVVGLLTPRRGSFFGENRQDNVMSIPAGTVRRLYPEAEATVLYVNALEGKREQARLETETVLRRLRKIPPGDPNDFNLSTSDQIIRSFDQVSIVIWLVTIALAGVSLVIGGIGIANVMVISVTERTREIGIRLAVGARRRDVLRQFMFEAIILSSVGGLAGMLLAGLAGFLITLGASGFSAMPPAWAVGVALLTACGVGVIAGYWPARRAARLDPIEALRHE
jgi:putative ABC transport system permease protein